MSELYPPLAAGSSLIFCNRLDRLAFASLPLALDIGSGLEITAYSSVELQRSLIQLDSLATLLMYDGGTRAAHAHRAIKTLNDPAAPLHNRTWAEYKLRKAILGWNESLPETLNEAKNSLSEVFRQCQVIQNQLKDAVAQVPKLRSLLGLKRQAEWIEWNAETIQKADAYKKYWSRLLDFLSLRLEATSRLTEAVARASDSTDVYRLAPIFNVRPHFTLIICASSKVYSSLLRITWVKETYKPWIQYRLRVIS